MPRADDAPTVKIPVNRTREGSCTVVHHQKGDEGGERDIPGWSEPRAFY